MSQLDLFPDEIDPCPPVDAPPSLRDLARRVPEPVRLGTSSWSFPGWAGLVYRDKTTKPRLARDGLRAYARHPLFRTVGVDRTLYAPVDAPLYREWAEQVPVDFRFVAKAHEFCTLARFPEHARYGSNRGMQNSLALDPSYATDAVVGPYAEGLGENAGVLLFQFAPQPVELFGGAHRFADRLHAFLTALPPRPHYAVEVRNRELLTTRYAAALADAGASHCINILPRMPDALTQWQLASAEHGPALVIRWLLGPDAGLEYGDAASRYDPFDRLVDEDPVARKSIADVVGRALARGKPAYVIVNNKAEGSSPLSVAKLAETIAQP